MLVVVGVGLGVLLGTEVVVVGGTVVGIIDEDVDIELVVELVVVVVQLQLPSHAPGTPPDSQYAPAGKFRGRHAVHPPTLA